VSAIGLKIMQHGRTLMIAMPQGHEGEPLILAVAVSEITLRGATRATATSGGYDPVEAPQQHIEITMAVFEDGSFEGDVEEAAGFRGFVKGRKIELRRIVDIFQTVLQDESAKPSVALEELRSRVNALGVSADSAAVQEVSSEFSALSQKPKRDLTSAVEAAMSGIRRDAQQDIAHFQLENPNMNVSIFRYWLVASKQKYEAWLARL
jgi:hypothetical protein